MDPRINESNNEMDLNDENEKMMNLNAKAINILLVVPNLIGYGLVSPLKKFGPYFKLYIKEQAKLKN